MTELRPESLVCQVENVVTREIGGRTVVLTPLEGSVHELDDVGSAIWNLCARPISIGAIASSIAEQYEVEEAVAMNDITSFLGDLVDIGAVEEK